MFLGPRSGKVDEVGAVRRPRGELTSSLNGETALTDPAGTDDGHEVLAP